MKKVFVFIFYEFLTFLGEKTTPNNREMITPLLKESLQKQGWMIIIMNFCFICFFLLELQLPKVHVFFMQNLNHL